MPIQIHITRFEPNRIRPHPTARRQVVPTIEIVLQLTIFVVRSTGELEERPDGRSRVISDFTECI